MVMMILLTILANIYQGLAMGQTLGSFSPYSNSKRAWNYLNFTKKKKRKDQRG